MEQQMIAEEIRVMLVEKLRLPMKPEEIGFEASFFEDIGLDSVDMLELVVGIEKDYGVLLTHEHREHFANILTLSSFVSKMMEEKEAAGDICSEGEPA